MKNTLRSIALMVSEPEPGTYCWRLLESIGDPIVYEEIARSAVGFDAYDAALATGYGELQRLAGTEFQHGPRSLLEDENADPVGTPVTPASLPNPGWLDGFPASQRSVHGG